MLNTSYDIIGEHQLDQHTKRTNPFTRFQRFQFQEQIQGIRQRLSYHDANDRKVDMNAFRIQGQNLYASNEF